MNPKIRWKNGTAYNHNSYFTNAIKKYGWDNFKHEILFENLSKEEAEQKEIELIAYYKSNIRKYGYNIQNGGNSYGKHSEESKLKMSMKHTGKKLSKETRNKMSEYHKGKCGKFHNRSKSCICLETGITYYSLAEANRLTGIDKSMIMRCCKGMQHTAGGYHWKYKILS